MDLVPGAGVVSRLEVFVTATAVDEARDGFFYALNVGGDPTSQDIKILGLGFSSPRFCPISDLIGANWAVVKLEHYVTVHRVTFLRDQSTNGRYPF